MVRFLRRGGTNSDFFSSYTLPLFFTDYVVKKGEVFFFLYTPRKLYKQICVLISWMRWRVLTSIRHICW